ARRRLRTRAGRRYPTWQAGAIAAGAQDLEADAAPGYRKGLTEWGDGYVGEQGVGGRPDQQRPAADPALERHGMEARAVPEDRNRQLPPRRGRNLSDRRLGSRQPRWQGAHPALGREALASGRHAASDGPLRDAV